MRLAKIPQLLGEPGEWPAKSWDQSHKDYPQSLTTSSGKEILQSHTFVHTCLTFARQNLNDPEKDWENVMWSDENKIERFGINSTCQVSPHILWSTEWKHHALESFLCRRDSTTNPCKGKSEWSHELSLINQILIFKNVQIRGWTQMKPEVGCSNLFCYFKKWFCFVGTDRLFPEIMCVK